LGFEYGEEDSDRDSWERVGGEGSEGWEWKWEYTVGEEEAGYFD
jgi:hypothetical protein